MMNKKKRNQVDLYFEDAGVRVEQNQAEFAVVFCPDKDKKLLYASKRRINLDNKGHYVEAYRSGDLGLIRTFDFELMIAIFLFGRRLLTGEIIIYIKKLKKVMKGKQPYKYYIESIKRLVGCRLYSNWWWDNKSKERISTDFVYLQYAEHIKNKKGKIIGFKCKFSDKIREQIENHYIKKYDFKKIREMKSSAKLLYMNIAKRLGKSFFYPTTIQHVIRLLGKEKKYNKLPEWRHNQYIKRTIIPMLKEVADNLSLGLYQDQKNTNRIIFAADLQGDMFNDYVEI